MKRIFILIWILVSRNLFSVKELLLTDVKGHPIQFSATVSDPRLSDINDFSIDPVSCQVNGGRIKTCGGNETRGYHKIGIADEHGHSQLHMVPFDARIPGISHPYHPEINNSFLVYNPKNMTIVYDPNHDIESLSDLPHTDLFNEIERPDIPLLTNIKGSSLDLSRPLSRPSGGYTYPISSQLNHGQIELFQDNIPRIYCKRKMSNKNGKASEVYMTPYDAWIPNLNLERHIFNSPFVYNTNTRTVIYDPDNRIKSISDLPDAKNNSSSRNEIAGITTGTIAFLAANATYSYLLKKPTEKFIGQFLNRQFSVKSGTITHQRWTQRVSIGIRLVFNALSAFAGYQLTSCIMTK